MFMVFICGHCTVDLLPAPPPISMYGLVVSSVEADGTNKSNVVPTASVNIDIGGEGVVGRDKVGHCFNMAAGCADSVWPEKVA